MKTQKFSTQCPPIDKLLNGGLTRGHILEVSGPPGTMKEAVGINVIRSFVEKNEHVLFVGELI
jgi:RAD51-like protein 2